MATILSFNRSQEKPQKRGGNIIRKPGSKKLYTDFYYNGKRIVKSTGLDDTPKNRDKAQQWLTRMFEKMEEGTFVFAEAFPGASADEKKYHSEREGWEFKPNPEDVVFGHYLEEWKDRFLRSFSENKRRDYTQAIDDWILPHFSEKTFFQITGVALKEFVQTLVWRTGRKKGLPLSASRIRNILIPLRAIWNDANEENRWYLPDPFTYVKKALPKRSKKHPDVFRFDEWIRIIENMDPFYQPIAEIMVMTGMIGSEIAGLRKADVLSDHIMIGNSIVRNHEKTALKTEYRARKLPMTMALNKRFEAVSNRFDNKYVFGMKSGRIFDVDSFRKNPWTSALKKAGLSYRVPYAMRHTFAAWALALRMDPNRLVNLMGHGSKKMIYEVYGNYVDGLETDAGKILEYFGNDFVWLRQDMVPAFAKNHGESTSESQSVQNHNILY